MAKKKTGKKATQPAKKTSSARVATSTKKRQANAPIDGELVKGVAVNDREPSQITVTKISQTMMRSAPLPDPKEFAEYERIVSGAGDRIITMAEKEQNSRHRMALLAFFIEIFRISSSIFVVLSVIVAAVVALYFNQTAAGAVPATILAIGGVAGVVRMFLQKIFGEKKLQKAKKRK